MQKASTLDELHKILKNWRIQKKSLALVPTMGALHKGHLSLIKIAKQHADLVAVTIFVNPTQFGPNEDLHSYPRTLEQDFKLLQQESIDLVFYPHENEIYGPQFQTFVSNKKLNNCLCGASRPNFFQGVCTICTKLFNLVKPDFAVFGKKDYQQFKIIEQLVNDLHFDVKIIPGPIIREHDGLATSSRNRYLSNEERNLAPKIYQTLTMIKNLFDDNQRNANKLVSLAKNELTQITGFSLDYCEIRSSNNLTLLDETINQDCLMFVAGYLGKTRLIDNIELTLKEHR